MMLRAFARAGALVLLAVTLSAQEPIDRDAITRIRAEGMERSQVLATFSQLVTVIGPRLTGSPAHKAAADYMREQFERPA